MDLIEKLNWRYATKRMNGTEVPKEKLDRILEAIRLSASSVGMQPYHVFVVKNSELKEELRKAANDQPQLTEASEVLVFAAWDNVNDEKIDEFIERLATQRGTAKEALDDFRAKLSFFPQQTAEQNFTWSSRQVYIALGTALIAAAYEDVDATPMEGFSNDMVDELMDLKSKGLKSVALLPLGYRDTDNDWLAPLKKVRKSREEMFELI